MRVGVEREYSAPYLWEIAVTAHEAFGTEYPVPVEELQVLNVAEFCDHRISYTDVIAESIH